MLLPGKVALLFVLLAVPARAESPGPFGVGADNQTSQQWEKWLPQMSSIGLGEMRCLRSTWGDVEPEEGKWTWDRLDRQLDDAAKSHVEFTGLFLGNPRWNTADAPGGFPVHNLAAWSTYVSETVKHVKGRAKYFEVWNEPPNFSNHGSPEDYAKLVVATYDAAKAADPNCQVGLAAQSVNLNYLERALKAGAAGHYDYITLHPYETLGCVSWGGDPVYLNIVPTVRKMLAAQDPARAQVPIWFTELGAEISPKITPEIQAQMLIKAYVMGIAEGVSVMQWFEVMDGDSGAMGLLERDGTPRPAYGAMKDLIDNLGAHPVYLGWVRQKQQDYGFVFQGPKGTVLVAWDSDAPHFVFDVAEGLVAQAKANRDLTIPWGGDFREANSVAIKFGKTNEEQGLHSHAGHVESSEDSPYGADSRAGSVPGGNCFEVDPGFLSYTTVPIEITVVVRRNPQNENAGFALKYEATSGLKSCGWYTVPEGKDWTTKTWRIDDAQFVGKWGYNFTLDSDGNTYNHYYIRSVTVTKVPSGGKL